MVEIASNENTLNISMKPAAAKTAIPAVNTASVFSAPATTVKTKAQPILDLKTICYDTETTGTNPWDYRLLGVSFWDLSKPVSTMVSLFDFDEEQLTKDIAEYLNTEKPAVLVQYNNGFDERALLTRFMLYQVPVPGWNDIQQIDVMQILQRGTTQNISSSQAVGTEEAWLKYFFDESKPFTIEECFAAVQDMDLGPFILRNRTCVESEGSLYLLFRSVTDIKPLEGVADKPTQPNIAEAASLGDVLELCPTCEATNEVRVGSKNNVCWRCLSAIPDPDSDNILKEVLREFDFSKVGTTSTTKKSTT